MKPIRRSILNNIAYIFLVILSFSLALTASGPVKAGLIGTSVTFNYHIGPNPIIGATSSTDVFTVTRGANITCPGAFNACSILTSPVQTITVGDNSITWDYDSRV